MKADVLLIVPFEDVDGQTIDPTMRRVYGAHSDLPMAIAFQQFEAFVGCRIGRPAVLAGAGNHLAHRSLTAVALATHLERAGLSWQVVDPGVGVGLAYWRRRLTALRNEPPRVLAISSTYVASPTWLHTLCAIARRALPTSRIVLGGYFYATDTREFLAADADVYCVGEGELRLPQIVRAIRDGASLANIPGLYLPRADGSLHFTGTPEPLDLATLPPVDWDLAVRMEPTGDPAAPREANVETQRGCVFRCEFCTFRTLTLPNVLTAEAACEAILNAARSPTAQIHLIDPTGTFPHERWEETLRLLIAHGGSPCPIALYGRVADLTDRTVAMMARAGVRHVFVGQESGDQRMLTAMRKGTRVEQVRPAVAALGRHGIHALFSFIHGFPGETEESIRATRAMLVSLNDGFERTPVVLNYMVYRFSLQDLASVAARAVPERLASPLSYTAGFSSGQLGAAIHDTIIAASRVPHAPAYNPFTPAHTHLVARHPRRYEIFRWQKAIERGVAIFLEQDLHGTTPDLAELRRLRAFVLEHRLPTRSPTPRTAPWVLRRLRQEWRVEPERGVGLLTRAALGVLAARNIGGIRAGISAFVSGRWPVPQRRSVGDSGAADTVRELGRELAVTSRVRASRAKLPAAVRRVAR